MRLQIFCQNRIGLMRELLNLLVARNIDLHGIETESVGHIYIDISTIDFSVLSALMSEIRRIDSIRDVRTVTLIPSERNQRVLDMLLMTLPEPVFFVDFKARIELANPAAWNLFALSEERLHKHNVTSLIAGFNFADWLESERVEPQTQPVLIRGRNFLLNAVPVYASKQQLIGALVTLKSIVTVQQQSYKVDINDHKTFANFVAVDEKMCQLLVQARKIAILDAPLLIIGETGTGKDMLAYACHHHSARSEKPFLALNCASLPDEVVESELFGHAPGAWGHSIEGKKGFFEQANGGSVLLDEIGEMSPRMQSKLLRFLNDGTFRRVGEDQEVSVDVRIICSTQKNLAKLVEQNIFRQDLYYRLNVLTLVLPPLRQRPQDILPLTRMFISRFATEQGIEPPHLSSSVSNLLMCYSWPGNVRQLYNVLYRALTQIQSSELCPEDLDLSEAVESEAGTLTEASIAGTLDDITSRFERSVLIHLYMAYPSTRKLAKRLGVSHTVIANKLREYGLGQRREEGDEKKVSQME